MEGEASLAAGVEEMPAFNLVLIQRINRIVCSCLGILLNVVVLVLILRSRHLWSPRNIFWLGVTLFNVFAVFQSIAELAIYYLHQRSDGSHQVVCQVYTTLAGCPYGTLLAGLTLASWDRYLALARHQFYQNHVTTKNATLALLLAFFIIIGLQTLPFWMRIFTVQCDLRYGWLTFTLLMHGVLSLTCLVVQTHLFLFIRDCIHYVPSLNDSRPRPAAAGNGQASEQLGTERRHRINRLELRAARILGLGILPFCLVTLTLSFSCFVLILIRSGDIDDCWILKSIMTTCRELILFHLVYIPAVFVTHSREFRDIAGRFYCEKRPH